LPDNASEIKTNPQLSPKPTAKIPPNGKLGFTLRCILRAGMLLRDSEKAREVRTALLNGIEKIVTIAQNSHDLLSQVKLLAQSIENQCQLEAEQKRQAEKISQIEAKQDAILRL
jgi:hypothetical protein